MKEEEYKKLISPSNLFKSNEEVKEFIKEGNREDVLHFLASCLEEERYEWCQIINEYLICL